MSLNETVSGERTHISFFGLRNAGKSSLVNAVTGQSLSIVSDTKGTTTDPVKKAMELLPLGPVLITDTPGLDDEGELGELRVEKAKKTLLHTDIAVLVRDATEPESARERELRALLTEKHIPFLTAHNKADLLTERPALPENELYVSAKTGENVTLLKEKLAAFSRPAGLEKKLVSDLLSPGEAALLVIPIDAAAPKGRLILPQQQTLRELLDAHSTALVCQPEEIPAVLGNLKTPPRLVITDSQAFAAAAKAVPETLPLTSFSILFARYKGDLPTLLAGAKRLRSLKTGDKVLIAEGCTHHRQCGDIGTEKLPRWIRAHCKHEPEFRFCSGPEFPDDITDYALIVHCGGCMLNETQMQNRLRAAKEAQVPTVNYGVASAEMHGILQRSLSPFPDLANDFQQNG